MDIIELEVAEGEDDLDAVREALGMQTHHRTPKQRQAVPDDPTDDREFRKFQSMMRQR